MYVVVLGHCVKNIDTYNVSWPHPIYEGNASRQTITIESNTQGVRYVINTSAMSCDTCTSQNALSFYLIAFNDHLAHLAWKFTILHDRGRERETDREID